MFITISTVSTSEDISQDNLTQVCQDIQEVPVLDENSCDDILSHPVASDNQNDSSQNGDEVLGSALDWDDITVTGNTKTINSTKGNAVIATVKLPKEHDAYLEISGYDIPKFYKKLSKETMKKYPSPDELNSLGYAFMEIQNVIML